ncbi:cytochrome b562 [Amphritea sp. HPY]|uniref:cytochrome b562 n=1 Tax=Amphritea sp. HPY TaxID=3421652 RepID=UPI003D7C91BD
MKPPAMKPLLCSLLLTTLLSTSGYACAGESLNLKQTMKQMRLQYKEALETRSADSFNQHIDAFKEYLHSAQGYDFSPERKSVSLEGLNKVERSIAEIPLATADNLAGAQQQLRSIDQLRKEYHKKAKPGVWELLLSMFE